MFILGCSVAGNYLTIVPATAKPQQDLQPNSANLDNPQWYYDNLNATDRLKIREAMDMAIPRQIIIDTLMNGMGQQVNSPILAQNGVFYNASLLPREFNTSVALDNMEEIFGYRFNGTDILTTPQIDESIPYFRLTQLVPVTGDLRTPWEVTIYSAWQNIGIDVTRKHLTWGVLIPRVFSSPVGVGFDYNNGGFDVQYVGWNINKDPNVRSLYHTDGFVPSGDNYIWLDDATNNYLIEQSLENLSFAVRKQAILDWQQWYYTTIPKSIIRQAADPWGADVNFTGFNPISIQNYDNWTIANQTKAVVTVPAEFVDLNPALVSSFYDTYVHAGAQGMGGLLYVHVPDGTGDPYAWQIDGYLAENWTISTNQTVWTLRIRDGLKWHDGSNVTADDVLYTTQLHLHEASTSKQFSRFAELLDNSSVIKINSSTVRFNFLNFDPYINSFLTFPIVQQAQLAPVGFANLNSHGTNDGRIAIQGYGPYYLDEVNTTGAFLRLNTNNISGQAWANSPLCSLPGRNCNPALTDIIIQKLESSTAALTALQTGLIDLVDSQTGLAAFNDQLESDPNTKAIWSLEYGYQEIGYNQMSPIWGINPGNPAEMYPPEVETLTDILTTLPSQPTEPTSVSPSTGNQNILSGLVFTFVQYTTGAIAGVSGGVMLGAVAILISRRRSG